jgi:hypothetical protein
MKQYEKIIVICVIVIMRIVIKAAQRDLSADKRYELCWLENSVTELEKVVRA